MNRTLKIIALAIAIGTFGQGAGISPLVAQVFAVELMALQTVTFAIENMTCALCPVTVKSAMEGVKGVASVQIDFEAKSATVVFDPAVTTVEAIGASSTNAGYPASAKG